MSVRRRRQCCGCGRRFTTYEREDGSDARAAAVTALRQALADVGFAVIEARRAATRLKLDGGDDG